MGLGKFFKEWGRLLKEGAKRDDDILPSLSAKDSFSPAKIEARRQLEKKLRAEGKIASTKATLVFVGTLLLGIAVLFSGMILLANLAPKTEGSKADDNSNDSPGQEPSNKRLTTTDVYRQYKCSDGTLVYTVWTADRTGEKSQSWADAKCIDETGRAGASLQGLTTKDGKEKVDLREVLAD